MTTHDSLEAIAEDLRDTVELLRTKEITLPKAEKFLAYESERLLALASLSQRSAQHIAALHMLHEQAHGDVSFALCSSEPCRQLTIPTSLRRGPAPYSLPIGE